MSCRWPDRSTWRLSLPSRGYRRHRRRPWAGSSISHVLGNRTYIGELWHVDSWHPGRHGPLLDVDLFERAQQRLQQQRQPAAAARQRGVNVLSGVVRCGRCGGAYVGTTGTSRTGAKVRYYTCGAARRYGTKTCSGPSLPAQDLEALVGDKVLEAYADPALFDEAIAAHQAQHAANVEPLGEQAALLRTNLARVQRLRTKYQDDYENDRLSAARYEGRAAELDEDIAALVTQLEDLDAQLAAPVLPSTPTRAQRDHLRDHLRDAVRSGDPKVRKEVFATLVEAVLVRDVDDLDVTIRLYGHNPRTG